MKQAGAAVGVDFTGKCDRSPNTLLAHVLMQHALNSTGENNTLAELLFKGYFTDGIFPDKAGLLQLASAAGLDAAGAAAALEDPAAASTAQLEARQWSGAGMGGVPFFLINGERLFSGAHPPASFVTAFANAAPLDAVE
jgi:predicted DsbA family dithiol-disulfide isomerase